MWTSSSFKSFVTLPDDTEVNVEVEYDYSPGYIGNREQPPEPCEVEITSITDLDNDNDKDLDYDSLSEHDQNRLTELAVLDAEDKVAERDYDEEDSERDNLQD
jgi:hypothetical protein